MKPTSKRSLQWLLTAALLIGVGFLLGTLRVDIFSFAQNNNTPVYDGPNVEKNRPDESIAVAKQLEDAFHFVANRARPAVVTVYTEKEVERRRFPSPFFRGQQFERFFDDMFPEREGRSRRVTGLGSGVIIRENGHILTNFHVIKDVDEIQVKLNNDEQIDAEIVGTDPKTDLAVLKVDRTGLPTAEFTRSSEVKVGQWAIAIGSPFHLRNTVNIGHVSATHRSITSPRQDSSQFQDFIQTDAAINRGNSGGPLVDIEGRVIGINTMIQSTSGGSQGIGFAVSSDMARRTANDLIEHGEVKRPWLGVVIQQLEDEVREEHFSEEAGVIVSQVIEESPAHQAGIQQGDFITHFDGKRVKTTADLQNEVLSHTVDDEVTITLKRKDETKQVTTTLAELPNNPSSAVSPQQEPDKQQSQMIKPLGMKLESIGPERAEEFGLRRKQPFFRVKEVSPRSPARRRGIKPDALILEVDRRSFSSVEKLSRYLEEKVERGGDNALLLINQDGTYFYHAFPLMKTRSE